MTSRTARPSKCVPRPGDTQGSGKRESVHIQSKQIQDSAVGEPCTFQVAGVCNDNWSTTVLCHLPDESHGMARKADDAGYRHHVVAQSGSVRLVGAMIWAKISDLCIKSGEWRIYRYPLADPERFELWRLEKLVGNFRTANEAKGRVDHDGN